MLTASAAHVPYYRDLLSSVRVTASNAPDVLAQMPVLTKGLLRQNITRLQSERPGSRIRWNHSGGSTGEPTRLLQDRLFSEASRSFELLIMRWAGHMMGQPHILIWGVPSETVDARISFHERVFRFVHNETYLNCYRIDDTVLDRWIATINRVRPMLIEAYVDALHELSKRMLDTGQTCHLPRGLIVSAGVLTDERRRTIREAFACPILNRYGSREVSNVACSCSQAEQLHVHEAMQWLEIVDDEGRPCEAGQEGHILVTVLNNYTMPLIRYRIEDRGVWAIDTRCICGRNTKRLANVTGRRNDYLVGLDGVRINGVALTTLMYSVAGLKQYQFRQAEVANVDLVVATLPDVPMEVVSRQLREVAHKLERMLNGVSVRIVFEREIEPSASGKFRYIINRLSPQEL